MNKRRVRVSEITVLTALQTRERMDSELANEYGELMKAGEALPPIECMQTEHGLVLTDGFHRVMGAKQHGIDSLEAIVREGTWSDAVWEAAGANRSHGLRRTIEDKRRAVAMLLGDAVYALRSDRDIARQVGVSHPFVASMRKRVENVHAVEPIEVDEQDKSAETGDDAEQTDLVGERMKVCKSALREVENQLRTIEGVIGDMVKEATIGAFLSTSISADLKDICTRIRHAMPYKVCPYCHGEGCETCKQQGWVSKLFWNTAVPSELKEQQG